MARVASDALVRDAPDHRALRCAGIRLDHRQQSARGWLLERGKAATDRIEQQKLGLISTTRQVFGANRQRPFGELLDDAWFVRA